MSFFGTFVFVPLFIYVLDAFLGILGAYLVYSFLEKLFRHLMEDSSASGAAFFVVASMAGCVLSSSLLPADTMLRYLVWSIYLLFFVCAACRIYEFAVLLRQELRKNSSR